MMLAERHSIRLPDLARYNHPSQIDAAPAVVSPDAIAEQWVVSFESALLSGDNTALAEILHQDCWWRDMLALSWDLRTVHGLNKVMSYVFANLQHTSLYNLRLRKTGKFAPAVGTPREGLKWIESLFDFETTIGCGSGMLRLALDTDGIWKGQMIYTALQELKGSEEKMGSRREHGGNNSLINGALKENWLERRERQREMLEEPVVLIIGAGQSGLNLGARLQAVGVTCLLVDKNMRIGDNWRNRYRTLVTHDPVQYTHMAYLPFPSNWPTFTPKDKLGDWFEAYASLMELNVWTESSLEQGSTIYDDITKSWTVQINRPNGSVRTLHPKHIVLCTGHAGEAKIPVFRNQSEFVGKIYHATFHKDASLLGNVAGRNVVVIGTGNSGHDIAQNYYENGANVTMVQRRGTYVISASKGLFMLHEGLYDETGPPTEDADIVGQSLPIPVQFSLNVNLTSRIAEAERANIEGLEKAGFKLDFGDDKSGIYRKYITRGGGYYIDVGCSQLIIDEKIKVVQSPDGISHFAKDSLVLANGKVLKADVVVLATGYDNMRASARKIFGDEVADKCKDVWDLDEEGEVNTMWRPSGHPGFWFMGGSLALCRIMSRFVALQIKAIEEGLIH